MSITITGGISFSGGVGIVAPPSVATAGWYGGGQVGPSTISTVNRMTFATDTATASVRGPLSTAISSLAATGNNTDGWFGGGRLGAPSFLPTSTVGRITYATDTAIASARGPLASVSSGSGGAVTDSSTYGWIAIGFVGAPTYRVSTVNRITYATDTDVASVRGPLAATTYNTAAACDNTYGWFGSGYVNITRSSTVTRITFATDTAISTDRGPLSVARTQLAGASGIQ